MVIRILPFHPWFIDETCLVISFSSLLISASIKMLFSLNRTQSFLRSWCLRFPHQMASWILIYSTSGRGVISSFWSLRTVTTTQSGTCRFLFVFYYAPLELSPHSVFYTWSSRPIEPLACISPNHFVWPGEPFSVLCTPYRRICCGELVVCVAFPAAVICSDLLFWGCCALMQVLQHMFVPTEKGGRASCSTLVNWLAFEVGVLRFQIFSEIHPPLTIHHISPAPLPLLSHNVMTYSSCCSSMLLLSAADSAIALSLRLNPKCKSFRAPKKSFHL